MQKFTRVAELSTIYQGLLLCSPSMAYVFSRLQKIVFCFGQDLIGNAHDVTHNYVGHTKLLECNWVTVIKVFIIVIIIIRGIGSTKNKKLIRR